MSGALRIAPATTGDLPALLALYAQLHPGDPPLDPAAAEDRLAGLAALAGSGVLIGWLGEVVVATCTLVVIPNLTRGGAPYGLIENMVTDAGHHCRGFGARMLRDAQRRAWAAGCYKVMLMTGSTRPGTLAFYEAAGFTRSKTGFDCRRPPP
ncbi:GNAT family N-acetyltransferase [Frigidibacter sp. MR17.14]|uniref:GNAT family N-acetyltransferase n=1 Tax=Frigidibacter sp. MR17.14 TaxID=3126509 RepID=UPI003012F438